MALLCSACGQTNSESAVFCSGCGRRLPSDRPGSQPGTPVLIGREHELGLLLSSLEDVFAGTGGLAMLVGEAGIGKTCIAREVARRAARRGAVVVWGACLEGDWQPAYGPWVEAIGEYGRTVAPERLEESLGPGAPLLAKLVPQLRAALPDMPETPSLGPDEEKLRIYDAVIQFLLALSRKAPVLLVIDDLHWADQGSLRLLRYLSHFLTRTRILVIGAYRELEGIALHPLQELLPVLRREADYRHVTVRGLGLPEVSEYLSQAAGKPLPGALVQTIYRETEGNPFYAREIFRHLAEEGKILLRDGRWSTDFSIREIGVPEGVRQVVRRRLSLLSDSTTSVLRMASGFTGGFDFLVLQALSGLPEDALLDCIDEALQAGLLTVTRNTPPSYDFDHVIVRHTIYDALNPDRRARLHRQIALALEQAYAGRDEDHAAELAFQYDASSSIADAGRGLPYALRAAAQAREAHAYDRAARFLQTAYGLATGTTLAERTDILCKQAIAEAEALTLEKAERTVRDALASLSAAGATPRAQAEFLEAAARAMKDGGAGPGVWKPLVEQGLANLAEPHDLLWARLMLILDPFSPNPIGEVNAVRWLGHDPEAVVLAREHGDEDDYARTLEPLEPRTRRETEDLLARIHTWRCPTAVLRALDVAGRDLLKRHGDHRRAIDVYSELLRTSERYGSIPGQAEALMQLAITNAALGEFSLAQQTAGRAQAMILRLGPAHELRFGITALRSVLTYFLDNNWLESTNSAARFAASPEAARNPRGLVAGAYASLGYTRIGDETAANGLLTSLTPVLERMEPAMYVHHAAIAFGGSAVWELSAAQFAGTYRRMALDLIKAGFGDSILSHELTVARMATLLGHSAEAERYFARVREKSGAHGLRPVLGISQFDEALALLRQGSTDRIQTFILARKAQEVFRSLGMMGWAERALSLQERVGEPSSLAGSTSKGISHGLTPREVQILGLLSSGRTNKEIAGELVLSVRTVERHIANIYEKIGARSRVEAATFALAKGFASPGV